MANWSKNFTNIDNVNSGREFTNSDYPTPQGFNVPINNTQYLYEHCVGTYTQTFTEAQKQQARNNIGAGTSNFDGNYDVLTNKPLVNLNYSSGAQVDTSYTHYLIVYSGPRGYGSIIVKKNTDYYVDQLYPSTTTDSWLFWSARVIVDNFGNVRMESRYYGAYNSPAPSSTGSIVEVYGIKFN